MNEREGGRNRLGALKRPAGLHFYVTEVHLSDAVPMPPATQPDVLICGAGPVGLTLASQLIRHDIAFRIIDKNGQRTELSKALAMFARSLELLHSGVDAHEFAQAGIPIESVLVFSNRREVGSIHLAGAESPFGTGVLIPQSETERILEESLLAMGTAIERNTELAHFEDLGDRVRCTLQSSGSEETLEPRWLIGCDGAHSICRHTLGLEFKGETEQHRWLLADVRIEGAPSEPSLINCLHQDGFLVGFRIRGDRFRLVAAEMLNSLDQPRVDPTLQYMQDLTDIRSPGGWRLHDPTWLTEFRINERKVDHYGAGRVFLAGDSAHVHSPAGGQGMNTGMQDVCNLAWKLALANNGVGGKTLLDSYSQERSEIGRQLLKNTGRLTRIVTLRSRLAQAFRNRLMAFFMKRPRFQHRIRMFLSELNIAYPDGPITGKDHRATRTRHGLQPGHRVPDLPLRSEHGDDTLHDLLTDPRITILLRTNATHGLEHIAPVENALPAAWTPHIQVIRLMCDTPHPTGAFHSADPQLLEHHLGLDVGSFAVIRPDGYVALLGDAPRPGCIRDWLDTISS